MVQWLKLCPFSAVGLGTILGWGTKIPQASQHGQERNKQKNPKTKPGRDLESRIYIEVPGEDYRPLVWY